MNNKNIFNESITGEIMERLQQGNKIQLEIDKKNNELKLFIVQVKRIKMEGKK